MKRNKINGIGTVEMSNVSLHTAGSFEIHIGFDVIGDDADAIISRCVDQYKMRYPDLDTEKDIYFDFNIIYHVNLECEPEFAACLYIWQKSDEETRACTCEYYGDFKLSLDEESKKNIKRIIWRKLGESLFNL